MIVVACTNPDCPQNGETFQMVGKHDYVVCGGCHDHLTAIGEEPDPKTPTFNDHWIEDHRE